MALRNVLQLLFFPNALEKESLEESGNTPIETIKEIIEAKRKSIFLTASWILMSAVLGIIAAQAVNYFHIISNNYVPLIRIFSLSILAFAVLSRLGDMQTFSGSTLPERTNTLFLESFTLLVFSLPSLPFL